MTDRDSLFQAVWSFPLVQVGEKMGVTASGVAKICDRLQIPRPDRNYWRLSLEQRAAVRPTELPKPNSQKLISLSPEHQAPAGRKRLPLLLRRAQMMEIAAHICLQEGVDAVSVNRIATEIGISEAQAHNCFARRIDLLVAIAQREVDDYEDSRRKVVHRGRDRYSHIIMSTVNFIIEAGRRGALLQSLLLDPEVREMMRGNFNQTRASVSKPIVAGMTANYGMSEEEAYGSNWLVTAISLRAGSLVSAGRLTPENAIRLCLPMVMGSIRSHSAALRG
jgi:AcrR family transcriptional regulator